MIQRFIKDASALRVWYWRIRYARSPNARRKWYRRAAKEKARLAGLGWDAEVIRRYGLYLRDPGREHRYDGFLKAFHEALKAPKQLKLF